MRRAPYTTPVERHTGRYAQGTTPTEMRGVLKWIRSKFFADMVLESEAGAMKVRPCCNRRHAGLCGFVPVVREAKSGRKVTRYTLPTNAQEG